MKNVFLKGFAKHLQFPLHSFRRKNSKEFITFDIAKFMCDEFFFLPPPQSPHNGLNSLQVQVFTSNDIKHIRITKQEGKI